MLALQIVMRLAPKFFVDNRQEFIQSFLFSLAPFQEQLRYVP